MELTSLQALLPQIDTLLSVATKAANLIGDVRKRKAEAPEPKRIEGSLRRHMSEVAAWASEVRVDPKDAPRTLADLFVDLDMMVSARSRSKGSSVPVSTVAGLKESVAILGQPGGGKTTSLKYLADAFLTARREDLTAPLPVLVRFRDLGPRRGLLHQLTDVFGGLPSGLPSKELPRLRWELVRGALEEIPVVLLLDGLDEARQESRKGIYDDLQSLLRADRCRIVLTCRTAEFRVTLSRIRIFEIRGLSGPQVRTLATRWLRDPVEVERFLTQLAENPYSGAEARPLTLVTLALLFIRKGEIPKHPRVVYERILKLFLEDWDESRMVVRDSNYSHFTIDRKESFLEALSFMLTKMGARGIFTHGELVSAHNAVHRRFELPPNQASAVAREIESHTGLVLERGNDEFEFFHLTIQEYLTARYLARRGDLATTGLRLTDHPNELAVATSWSSEPEVFMLAIVRGLGHFGEDPQAKLWKSEFVTPFLNRLALEAPRIQRSSLLGLALLHLGHFYCQSELEFGDVEREALKRFAGETEVAASLRMMKGRYLLQAPKSPEETKGYLRFRVASHKVRTSKDEALKIALRELPLPERLMVPDAFIEAMKK